MKRRLALFALLGLVIGLIPLDIPGRDVPSARAFEIPLTFSAGTVAPGLYETEVIEHPFTLAALSWEGERPDAAWFRTRAADGTWSEWHALGLESDHGPDPGTAEYRTQKEASDPVWTGAEAAVQFRVESDAPLTAWAALVDTTDRTKPIIERIFDRLAPAAPEAEAAAPGQPFIHPRSEWDPNDSCAGPDGYDPEYVQVTIAYVHHTAASNDYTSADVPSIIAGHCAYHTITKGWKDLAYNIMIDKFGGVWEGRRGGVHLGVSGAHTGGFNSYSMGIGLMGNFDPTPAPSAAMQESLIDVLAWKASLHNLDPAGTSTVVSKGGTKWAQGTVVTFNTISGHRDASSTSCPGDGCYTLLSSFRSSVDSLWSPIPHDTYVNPLTGDFTGDGVLDGAVYRPGDGTWWVIDGAETFPTPEIWADYSTGAGWEEQLVGDFNGDGRDDIANYHPSNGTWWVSTSTGSGFTTSKWGTFGTAEGWSTRVVADFNGDGNDDIGNFHPSNGSWWISESNGAAFVTKLWALFNTPNGWGTQTVGDFTGDGLADIANYHPSNGTWWISRSTGEYFHTTLWSTFNTTTGWQFQQAGDFNGDGKDDIVNFHPLYGNWWFTTSTGSGFTIEYGTNRASNDHFSYLLVMDVEQDGADDLVVLDAYNGFWYRGSGGGDVFEFVMTEDAAWRTTVGMSSGRISGDTLLTYYGQEFRWQRTTGLATEASVTVPIAALPRD